MLHTARKELAKALAEARRALDAVEQLLLNDENIDGNSLAASAPGSPPALVLPARE